MSATLSVREAAMISGANLVYVQKIVAEGKIKSQRVAGRRFVDRADFERWLKDYRIRQRASQ